MNNMVNVKSEMDIPEPYCNTPIARILLSHNRCLDPEQYDRAEVLVLMCMDNRQALRLPKKFAFIVRNGGATRNGVSFSLSFTVAVGGIRHIAVIGHSDCMMVDLESRRMDFVRGLSECGGWDKSVAESYFHDSCLLYNKKDAVSSVLSEVDIIRTQFPGIVVAPLYYSLEDDLLYLIN